MSDLFDWWWLFSLVLFCLLGCLFIFIIVVTNLFGFDVCLTNVNQASKPMKSVQWLSSLSLISFTISCASQIYTILQLDPQGDVTPDFMSQFTQFTGLLAWTFAQLFIYLLFIANLYYSFNNTILRISSSSLIFLITSIILFFCCRVAYITLYTLYYNGILSTSEVQYPLAYTVCATEFCDLIVSIILVYLFIARLFKLVRIIPTPQNKDINGHEHVHHHSLINPGPADPSVNDSNTTTMDLSVTGGKNGKKPPSQIGVGQDDEIVDVLEEYNGIEYTATPSQTHTGTTTYNTITSDTMFDERQETILYVASKYVILSSIAIVSTQLFLVSAAFDALSFSENSTTFYLACFSVYYGLLAVDSFINALCICLNFEFNKVWFWTICCLCDDCCYSICLCLSKRNYRSNYKSNLKSYRPI